jgi:dissimilatory sulfite reductase related protein
MGESEGPSQALARKFRLIENREILFDGDDFLWYAEDWSEDVAVCLARESGIEAMGDAHWRVIRFLREYFMYYGRAPLNRELKAALGMSLMEMEGLFPGGIKRGARRVAGLPNPKSCSG